MDFNTFCNICYYKENLLELYGEEYNTMINILITLTGAEEILKEDTVYLCTRCCGSIKNYDNFRKMILTNLVQFRKTYKHMKKELSDDPDVKMKLEKIVQENVFKENSVNLFEDLKEIDDTPVTNNVCFEDTTVNNASTVYVKTEFCDESFNDLECSNLEKKIDNYGKDESYILPIKQENMDESSSDEDMNPIDNCSIVDDDSDSKNSDIELGNALFPVQKYNIKTHGLAQDKFNSECIVSTCTNTKSNNKTLVFHTLPRKEQMRNIWLERINRTDLINTARARLGKILVCGQHFAINQYRHPASKRLNFGAVPNIIDPNKPPENSSNDTEENKKIELKCKICKRDFSRQESLTRHEKLHSGRRPYECKICHGKFMTPWNLNRHLFVHSVAKPYQCNNCMKVYSDLTLLRTHQQYLCNVTTRLKTVKPVKTYLRKPKLNKESTQNTETLVDSST